MLQEFFIYIFPVTNFYDKDDKPFTMNFVNYPIITRSYFMKRMASLHFGCRRLRQILGYFVNLFLDPLQVFLGQLFEALQDSGPELNRIFHGSDKPQILPNFFRRDVFSSFSKGFFCIFDINMVFNKLK